MDSIIFSFTICYCITIICITIFWALLAYWAFHFYSYHSTYVSIVADFNKINNQLKLIDSRLCPLESEVFKESTPSVVDLSS